MPFIERRTDLRYETSHSSFFDNGIGRLVTVRELATILAVSEKTVRDWVFKRRVPTVRPGPRMVRFALREIGRWLLERESET